VLNILTIKLFVVAFDRKWFRVSFFPKNFYCVISNIEQEKKPAVAAKNGKTIKTFKSCHFKVKQSFNHSICRMGR
jgi:hypothetical protein